MITVETARKLKEAGLVWQPSKGDQFMVPEGGMDEQVFVLSDMAVLIESLKGHPAVTFHGTPEWASDYVFVVDTLWLPSESQLRLQLQQRLAEAGAPVFDLLYADGAYTCRFENRGQGLAFRAEDAAEAYASALLHSLTSA
jgi:hypothetical protein